MWVGCTFGLAIRLLLYAAGAPAYLEEHLELNSPMTSHTRLQEGLFLLSTGASPYAGDACHHPPLLLMLLAPLQEAPPLVHFILVAMVDLAVALLLRGLAAQYAAARAAAGSAWAEAATELPAPAAEEATPGAEAPAPVEMSGGAAPLAMVSPAFVGLTYMLNPLTIASCLALSLQNLQHLLLVAAVCCAGRGRGASAAAFLALSLYVCPFTPVVLLPGCAFLAFVHQRCRRTEEYVYQRSKEGVVVEPGFLIYFLFFSLTVMALFACLLWTSVRALGGDTQFLQASFISVLTLRDLTPNVGIFWYIFIEIFDRYRALFLLAFHAHLLFYPAPLHLRVGRHLPVGPWLHCTAAIGIITIFKPYPTASDYGLMLSALLIQAEVIRECKKLFACLLSGVLFGLSMFPTMTAVWLGRNAGNANFLYNMTLVVNVFGCLLLTEWLRAGIKIRRRQHMMAFCRERLLAELSKDLKDLPGNAAWERATAPPEEAPASLLGDGQAAGKDSTVRQRTTARAGPI